MLLVSNINMISITIKEYKIEKEDVWIELFKEVEESYVESIDELKGKASEKYRTIQVCTEISKEDLEKFSPINSIFDNIFLARIENTFFIFGKKEIEKFIELFEKDIAKSVESIQNLKIGRLKRIIRAYNELVGDVHKEKEKAERGEIPDLKPIDELSKKNEEILPLLKQDKKRLEHLKALAKTEKYNGVFNSLLREIEEEKVYGLETSIKTSSDAANLLLQHYTLQMELKTQESLKKLQDDTKRGIKEMVSLERAIEGLYLFIGTYYMTNLIILLKKSYSGIGDIQFPHMVLIVGGALLFSYTVLNLFKKKS